MIVSASAFSISAAQARDSASATRRPTAVRLRQPQATEQGGRPQVAVGPVQYGPRIAAIIVYLYAEQFLSKQRTAQALADLFGIPLSSGTVAALTARAAARLGEFLQHARGADEKAQRAGPPPTRPPG
jgi:hypothetical protein